MVAETSTALFARVSFAGAECGLQSRSGLAAESFDSTSLATRFLPTTTPTTATRDDGARARGRRRRILRRRARERFLFFHGDKSNVDYIHLVFEPPRILYIPYMRDAARARAPITRRPPTVASRARRASSTSSTPGRRVSSAVVPCVSRCTSGTAPSRATRRRRRRETPRA